MTRIYLDYNATSPLDPRVQAAMLPYLSGTLGNPSSLHAEGRRARGAIDLARDEIATWLRGRPSEIIFTGGGTESNNLAIEGLSFAHAAKGRHLITSRVEHHAVLHAMESLEKRHDFSVTYLPVDSRGLVDPAQLKAALRPETSLVSIISANNETGVVQPIAELAQITRSAGALFHTDAVQMIGRAPVPADKWGVDALSFTAHKLHGPLGAGVLWLRAGIAIAPILHGGSHENERRPGTENTAAIVGLATAVRLFGTPDAAELRRQDEWIDALWVELAALGEIRWNGQGAPRLPNTLSLTLSHLHPEHLLIALDLAGLSVSSGSACLVGSVRPSHVLAAMFPDVPTLHSHKSATIRISIGTETADSARADVATRISDVVKHQRALS